MSNYLVREKGLNDDWDQCFGSGEENAGDAACAYAEESCNDSGEYEAYRYGRELEVMNTETKEVCDVTVWVDFDPSFSHSKPAPAKELPSTVKGPQT